MSRQYFQIICFSTIKVTTAMPLAVVVAITLSALTWLMFWIPKTASTDITRKPAPAPKYPM